MRTAVLSPGRRSRLGLERQPRLRGPRWLSAERLDAVAQTRSWVWPLLSAAVAFVSATALAAVHQQIDLGTHLMGGAHAFQPDLYRVTYLPTGLGSTYPPFAALWIVPLEEEGPPCHRPTREIQTALAELAVVVGENPFGTLTTVRCSVVILSYDSRE